MQRWARAFVGLAFVAIVGADAAAGGADSAAGKSAPRYACVRTANDAELKVDLGAGDGGAWQSEITLTVMGGTGEISGTVYDVDRMTAKETTKKRKPPR